MVWSGDGSLELVPILTVRFEYRKLLIEPLRRSSGSGSPEAHPTRTSDIEPEGEYRQVMSRDTFLQLAERHVVEGEMRVSAQRMRVARLQARGCDTADAGKLLGTMELTLATMYADLEAARLRADPPITRP